MPDPSRTATTAASHPESHPLHPGRPATTDDPGTRGRDRGDPSPADFGPADPLEDSFRVPDRGDPTRRSSDLVGRGSPLAGSPRLDDRLDPPEAPFGPGRTYDGEASTAEMDDLADALRRPLPPRTWRDRLDDLMTAAPSPTRILGAVVAVVLLAAAGWRLLAPPPPPPELDLPFAEEGGPAAGSGGPTGTDGGGAGPSGVAAGAVGGSVGTPAGQASGADPGDGTPGGPAGAVAGEVVVHVAGAVATPGVQHLPTGARVIDAVEAAGGALPDADLARINLAAPVVDGQQVYVLRQGEAPPLPPAGAGGAPGGDGAAGGPGGLVDVNRATADELDELPGVGPTTAEAIIAHREEHGPFATVDDLLDVRGIGEAKLEQLRDLVTV